MHQRTHPRVKTTRLKWSWLGDQFADSKICIKLERLCWPTTFCLRPSYPSLFYCFPPASTAPPPCIMSPSLQDLPNEVIESIVALSDLGDICSLRLCSRPLATKATQVHFKSYFLSRHVDIIDTSLRAFVHLTQPGWLGCLIQHLVLVGVINNTRPREADLRKNSGSEEADDDRESVTKAQQDLDILKQRQVDFQQMHASWNRRELNQRSVQKYCGKWRDREAGLIVSRSGGLFCRC